MAPATPQLWTRVGIQAAALQTRCSYGSNPECSRHDSVVAQAVAGGCGPAGRRIGGAGSAETDFRKSTRALFPKGIYSGALAKCAGWPGADQEGRSRAVERSAVDFH